MFKDIKLHATLPASDFARAKAWYAEKLELTPTEEVEGQGAAWYQSGGARFLVYQSEFAGTNKATAAGFSVEDVDAAAATLRDRGVTFEDVDMGEMKTENGILTLPDGRKAAWFKDSEGNILAISKM